MVLTVCVCDNGSAATATDVAAADVAAALDLPQHAMGRLRSR